VAALKKINILTSGSIPAKLLIILSTPKMVGVEWDDLEEGNYETKKIEVRPGFVSDIKNKKTIETGRKWAKQSTWDYEKKEYKTASVTELEADNVPKSGYRIVSLDIRQKGGRAWKVVSPEMHWFDLREDVLLDLMIEEGVSPGGLINGAYIWARVGSEMKLVRYGSQLHEALINATARKNTKAIRRSDMVPGKIYELRNGSYALYLGELVSERTEETKTEKSVSTKSGIAAYWSHHQKQYTYSFHQVHEAPQMVFFVVTPVHGKTAVEAVAASIKAEQSSYHYEFKDTHTCVFEAGEIHWDENSLAELRKSARKKRDAEFDKQKGSGYYIGYYLRQWSRICSMRAPGEPVDLDPTLEQILVDSQNGKITHTGY
jgi:hypothetical protein